MRSSAARLGRRVPLWTRCLAAGIAISFTVAVAHWLLVEVGLRPRPVLLAPDSSASGQDLVQAVHVRMTGEAPREAPYTVDRYTTIAYGWPVASFGSVFRQRRSFYWQDGVDPVIAPSIGALWRQDILRDPFNPDVTMAQAAAAARLGQCGRATRGYDAYARYLPIFPLIGPSLFAALFYGLPFYIWFKARDLRRRGCVCLACGYDIRSVVSGICPECGAGVGGAPRPAAAAAAGIA